MQPLRPTRTLQHAVRWEEPGTRIDDQLGISPSAARYLTNEPLIDGLLDPTTPMQARDDLQRDLGVLPTPLLRAVSDHGVRIWVAPPGVTQAPARLFTQSPACRDEQANLRGEPGQHPAHAFSKAPGAWATAEERPPFFSAMLSALGATSTEVPGERPHAGQTLEGIARARGARTLEDTTAFVVRAVQLNREQGNPIAVDHLLRRGERVMLPDVYFYQGQPFRGEERRHIESFNDDLADPGVMGSYSYRERVLMLKAQVLPDPAPGDVGAHRVALHEVGHIAEHLLEHDPDLGPAHVQRMEALHRHSAAASSGTPWNPSASSAHLITDYAGASRLEHYAEGFEAYWTATRRDHAHHFAAGIDSNIEQLRTREPALHAVLDEEMRLWEADRIHPREPATLP